MKKLSCPFCEECYKTSNGLYEHIEHEHSDNIPDGMSKEQYLYFLKTGKSKGKCVVCKSDTSWNDDTCKYKRFCNNPKCKEKYVAEFKKRMIDKYGKTSLLNEPDQQRKMLANRKISGKYTWTDGTIKTYTGSYELDFLKFLDVFMDFESDNIITPSPHTYFYVYNSKKHFYIPDVWIPSLNLEIEIKESDNNHPHMKVDREKERLKDELMNSYKNIDYLKIVDKKYDIFFEYLAKRKEEFLMINDKNKYREEEDKL